MTFTWTEDILRVVKMFSDLVPPTWAAPSERGHVGHPEHECDGPCFDFCPCEHCWNGWSELSFLERLRGHVAFLWAQALQRQAAREGEP